MIRPLVERRLHLSAPGDEEALRLELVSELPEGRHAQLGPRLVESLLPAGAPGRRPVLAFCRQVMPDAAELVGESVSALARALLEALRERLAAHEGPWRLHAFTPEPGGPVRPGRPRLLEEALDEVLARKLRRLRRTRSSGGGPLATDEALVQVALVEPSRGLLSIARPAELFSHRHVVSGARGGAVEPPDDPRPPSRAYRKLCEAELRLGVPIAAGETCVDLGASPGGWTFVAVARGARVTAVDRSPLRDDLMGSPLVEFVRGDAFDFTPDRPVDWLLCDLIAFPERSLALIERWLAEGLCRRFVVTVKFRGAAEPERLAQLKAILRASGADFRLRRLDANKNELTAFGFARDGSAALVR